MPENRQHKVMDSAQHEAGCVRVDSPGRHCATVIWLHGMGADGHDFESLVPELGLGTRHGVRFIFPHAPVRPVTINGGLAMRAWYDIVEMSLDRTPDRAGIADSVRILEALIAREVEAGIPAFSIVIAGFSQGGAIALCAACSRSESLAGIMALSTYLPDPDRLSQGYLSDSPILQCHGSDDPIVPLWLAQSSRDRLVAAGAEIEFKVYPMPHSLHPEQIGDIRRWLKKVLPDAGLQSH